MIVRSSSIWHRMSAEGFDGFERLAREVNRAIFARNHERPLWIEVPEGVGKETRMVVQRECAAAGWVVTDGYRNGRWFVVLE